SADRCGARRSPDLEQHFSVGAARHRARQFRNFAKGLEPSYPRNSSEYHSEHVAQALSILSVYDRWRRRSRDEGELLASRQTPAGTESLVKTNLVVDDRESPLLRAPAFTTGEMLEIRARLILSG